MFPSGGGPSKQASVYQIDFTAVASGKRIASSKRRVRWRFGFANTDALAAGQTGTDCRGEEHDVTIVWSITSGKRLVLMDGKEIHFSSSRTNVFDFTWTSKGNHVMKVIAHAQPPMSAQPGFRQYDFFVDGQSFFTFPKVFRLGLAPNDPRGAGGSSSSSRRRQQPSYGAPPPPSNGYGNSNGRDYASLTPYANGGNTNDDGRSMNSNNIVSIETPHNPEEEDAYLRQAIENSLKEGPSPTRAARPPAAPSADTLLLDFMAPPAAAAPAPFALPPSTSQYPGGMYGAPPQQQQPPAFAALPPSTTAPPPQQQPPQQQMVHVGASSDPWGMASMTGALPPAQPASNPYAAAPMQQQQQQQPVQAPAPVQDPNPYAAPVQQQQQQPVQDPFGAPVPPTPVAGSGSNPFGAPIGSPPPTSIAGVPETPATQASSIGFASPMAQPFRPPEPQPTFPDQQQQTQFGEAPEAPTPEAPAPEAPAPSADPALLSMNVLSGQPQSLVTESMTNGNGTASGSLADQAYAKLVNMDAFDLVTDKASEARKNPFEASGTVASSNNNNANANLSLADMKAKKSSSSEPKKSVMNTPAPAAPGALVLSGTQQGNFGGYGGLAMQQQQPQMGGMMGQQQQQQQQPMYGGMQQQQQPMYGGMQQQQPPPQMGGYGQQQPPPVQQQQGYGMQQPQYGQQQQQQYPPPLQQQQQPFGF